MTPSHIIFWILAILSVFAALRMITDENPVRSALALVSVFLCQAILYITLDAQFLAAVQVMVYAGAIMVLFLFVIMLLNLGAPPAPVKRSSLQPIVTALLAAVTPGALLALGAFINMPMTGKAAQAVKGLGTVQSIGQNLYDPGRPWLFPFELTSLLLLTAVVGAIVIAARRRA